MKIKKLIESCITTLGLSGIMLFGICIALYAGDYNKVASNTEYITVKEKDSQIPVGGIIAEYDGEVDRKGYLAISGMSETEITIFEYEEWGKNTGTGAVTARTKMFIGTCKVGQQLTFRSTTALLALRITLKSIDIEHGSAIMEITKFWPTPNSPKLEDVGPMTPEKE